MATANINIGNDYSAMDAACDPKNMKKQRMMSHDKRLSVGGVEKYFSEQNSENKGIPS